MEEDKNWIDIITDASDEIVHLRKLGFDEGHRLVQIQLEIIQEAVNSMTIDSSEAPDGQGGEVEPPWASGTGPVAH